MLAHLSAAPGMTRRGHHILSMVVVSGLVACAPDATSPASDVPATCSGPCPQPLQPWAWLPSPSWALSDLPGELLFSSSDTLYAVAASHSAEPRKVIEFSYRPSAVAMSPDGTRAVTLHPDGFFGSLCVIDGGVVGTRRCVQKSGGELAWTPDGQALVLPGYREDYPEAGRLMILDPATLEFRVLLPWDWHWRGTAQNVTVTPDGKSVSFTHINRLWRMPMSGGVPELQPGFEEEWQSMAVRWSPDGKSIALLSSSGGAQTLSVANADGSNRRVLLSWPAYPDRFYCQNTLDRPVWSPDGEWLGLSAIDCVIQPAAERTVIVSSGGKGARILPNQGVVHDWR